MKHITTLCVHVWNHLSNTNTTRNLSRWHTLCWFKPTACHASTVCRRSAPDRLGLTGCPHIFARSDPSPEVCKKQVTGMPQCGLVMKRGIISLILFRVSRLPRIELSHESRTQQCNDRLVRSVDYTSKDVLRARFQEKSFLSGDVLDLQMTLMQRKGLQTRWSKIEDEREGDEWQFNATIMSSSKNPSKCCILMSKLELGIHVSSHDIRDCEYEDFVLSIYQVFQLLRTAAAILMTETELLFSRLFKITRPDIS